MKMRLGVAACSGLVFAFAAACSSTSGTSSSTRPLVTSPSAVQAAHPSAPQASSFAAVPKSSAPARSSATASLSPSGSVSILRPSPTKATSAPPPTTSISTTFYSCSRFDVFNAKEGASIHLTAKLGGTTATLTGTSVSGNGGPAGLRDGVFTVAAAGHPGVSVQVTPTGATSTAELMFIDTEATASGDFSNSGPLCVAQFAAGTAPVALLALTSGGAHCCTEVRALSPVSDAATAHDFGNYGPMLKSSPNGTLLISADNTFAYAFTAYADSDPPIEVFTFGHSKFTDVTRAHLDLVQADLADHWGTYNDPASMGSLGALAGWVADKCLLDPAKKAVDAWQTLDELNAAGKLIGLNGWPSGSDYLAQLHTMLASNGYCVAATG